MKKYKKIAGVGIYNNENFECNSTPSGVPTSKTGCKLTIQLSIVSDVLLFFMSSLSNT